MDRDEKIAFGIGIIIGKLTKLAVICGAVIFVAWIIKNHI